MKHHSIHFRAKFTISEEKIKEYKKLIKEMSNLVEANEPETRCIVPETYRNPEVVFFHMDGIESNTVLPKIHEISRIIRLEVNGAVSKKLHKAMEGLNPQAYFLYTGFNR